MTSIAASAAVEPRRAETGKDGRFGSQSRLTALHVAVRGRARFKVLGLYRQEDRGQQLEIHLVRIAGIHNARTNFLTGSLLIHFDPVLSLADLVASVERELTNLWGPVVSAIAERVDPAMQPNLRESQVETGGVLGRREAVAITPANGATKPDPRADPTFWHTLDEEEVLSRLASARHGLTNAAARVRLAQYGPNELPQPARRSDLALFLEQFASPPVALLGISAAVSLLTGGILEVVAIAGVVVINALIGFVTERQSERVIASLTPARADAVEVLRDGRWQPISGRELVGGDVIALAPGHFVAADARLLASERLTLDESALTGESMPVEKRAGSVYPEDTPLGSRLNMVYMGTLITGGSGCGVVVGTALNTELGRIQALAEGARPPETPMERQLQVLGGQLVWLSSAICAAVFGIGLLRGYGWLTMLKASISLAVAAVPEGLPMVATTTLALGIHQMRRRKVLVRQLDAVETLGSVQFFCFDKTGTLTQNRMTVITVHCNGQRIQREGKRFFQSGRLVSPSRLEAFQQLCEAVALCNETEVNGDAAHPRLNGSATETALLEMALHAGLDVMTLRRRHPRIELRQRAEDRPYMVSIHRDAVTDECRIAVKGSPEHVLALCRLQLRNGQSSPLNDEARRSIVRENERMAGAALRVLGVAHASGGSESECLESLVWLGLVGMTDPLRPGMALLLKRFHDAGISTAMITGDQSATAYAIAKQLDLANGQPVEILDAGSLDRLDPQVLSGVAQRVQVFARVSPAHKLQIVQALQRARKIVAMTGDGINDGPALKAADLGVAMGKDGTEVARSLADIVLEDDNLETMEVAVRHGRAIYDNVRKAIRFLLATNLSEIEVMLAGIGLGLGQPLNPLQLLWINLISDIFPGLALALEQPEADIMARPPRDPGAAVIDARDLRRLGLESTVLSAGALASYGYAVWRYGSGPQASTQAFMTLTLGQLLHALSSRSETYSLLDRQRLPPNRYLDAALGLSLFAQVLTVLVPGLRQMLGNSPLGLTDSLIVGAGATLPLLINELTKKIVR